MEIDMNIKIIYFSGTGNTQWITNLLKEQWEHKNYKVEVFSIEDILSKKRI
jgi:flavodoxin